MERTAQLLDAFEACVRERGLGATSFDHIASAAGLDRRLIPHYFGSRDALVETFVERIVERVCRRWELALERLPQKDRIDGLLDWMFLGGFHDADENSLLAELTSHGHRDGHAHGLLQAAYRELEACTAVELARAYPGCTPARTRAIAFSVIALCLGAGDLCSAGMPRSRRHAARAAAALLVDELGGTGA